jgi:uncharacterized membrane protein YeaQ/YmgE (transglycosylase-associated protein family)
MAFFLSLLIGGVVGWITAQQMKKIGDSLLLDIAVGVIGGLIGSWVFGVIGIISGLIGAIITAIIGAAVLLAAFQAAKRAGLFAT